jgi:hypothetical protein
MLASRPPSQISRLSYATMSCENIRRNALWWIESVDPNAFETFSRAVTRQMNAPSLRASRRKLELKWNFIFSFVFYGISPQPTTTLNNDIYVDLDISRYSILNRACVDHS